MKHPLPYPLPRAPRSRWLAALVAAAAIVALPMAGRAMTKAVPAAAAAADTPAPVVSPHARAHAPAAAASPVIPAAAAPGAVPGAVAAPDIRDIRPPYHLPPGWLWLAWVAAGCGIAIFAFALWRWRRCLPGLQSKLPFELALEELEAAREFMQPEQAREFSIRVSEIVRRYIEVRFGLRAAHRTTGEFLHDCMEQPAASLAAHRESLGDFLYYCDLAKFARWVLVVPEMEALLHSASAFVRDTGQVTASAAPGTEARTAELTGRMMAGKTSTPEPQLS